MKRGEDTLMPNWALDAIESLTLATDIKTLVRLTRYRHYRCNTYSTKQLAIAIEADPRTMRDCLERLRTLGLVLSFDGVHCAVDAASKLPPAKIKAAAKAWDKKSKAEAVAAQAICNAPATPLQKDPASAPESAVPHSENQLLNKGTDELMKQSRALQEEMPGLARPEHHEEQALESIPASLEKSPVDVGGDLAARVLPPSPGSAAPPSPAAPAASSTALGLFMDLFASHAEGQRFCTHNAGQLDRWAADYTPEFVRLAWRLAPTVPGVHRPQHALAWLLNREREWPTELRRQYRDDLRAAGQHGGDEPAPAVGEVRVLTDGSGRSGRVLEVYPDTRMLRLQIGQDETEAIDTPWSVTAPSVRASVRSVI